jgi:hypothetical protein
MRQALQINNNEQEMSMKDEKSSETLSEETLSTRGGNQSESGNLQIKNNNELINQELLMNNRFLQQQPNYMAIPYNMNNINNLNNINNINNSLGNINNLNNMNNNNYNNMNNMQNISNYNQNIVNQINNLNNLNNLGNLNNLSMGNFQMPIYDQQNNQLFNPVIAQNMKQNYSLPINDDMNINNHKKIKKIGNKSPNEQNFSMNPNLNLGNVLPNLNYNGPNINNNMNINNKKISLSSQAPKNTIPNFNPGENLNLAFNPNKINQGISPLLNMNINPLGKNFYIPQNMKNTHMNNNMWNNLNNNNNTHMNGPNTNNNIINANINDNFQGNKINNLYNKKDFNNRINHNNNASNNNNKKYQKLYNHNSYQPSNMNNNNYINNKKNLNQNIQINETNLNNSNNSNKLLQKKLNINNNTNVNTPLRSISKPNKKYLLSLCIKLNNNEQEIINIKSLKDTSALLQEIKEKRNLNEKTIKLIQMKINNAVEIIQKIFDYNLNKHTYKNLVDINHQLINNREEKVKEKVEEKGAIKIKKNNSSKQVNKYFKNDMKLTMNDAKKNESLNISY